MRTERAWQVAAIEAVYADERLGVCGGASERAGLGSPHNRPLRNGVVTKVDTFLRLGWFEGYFVAGASASEGLHEHRRDSVGAGDVAAPTERPFRLFLFPAQNAPDLATPALVAGQALDLHPLAAVLAGSA